MKKLLALLLIAVMCLSFVACGGSGDTETPADSENTENNGNMTTDNDNSNKKFSVDLEGYVANIGNATALGIAQKQNTDTAPLMANGRTESLSFLNLSSSKDTENKNYIVMSTTEYDANTPEADKNGLTKVTFTKTVTENVTTETTGTKYITASEGQITILAVTGFTYTIYKNETILYESVQDNDATDTNGQEGVIVLTGLTDGTEYKVDYKGIGEEITITQDEINGEIDKLYIMNGYTFISFVPRGISQRPENSKMEYDEKGIAIYDKTGYFSNAERQSFVIDNTTGLVYLIKNIEIEKIENNLIIISNKIYDMYVADNGELNFVTVVKNETLTIYHYFKDKYGNKYILNDFLNAVDTENSTIYYTNKLEYLYSDQDIVIHRHINEDDGKTTAILKISSALKEEDISLSDQFYFDQYTVIKDSWLYITYNYGNYRRINVETLKEEYAQQNEPISQDVALVDYKTLVAFLDGNLYYGDVFGNKAAYPNGVTSGIEMNNLTLIIANVVRSDKGDSFSRDNNDYTEWRFRKTTIEETIFYRITVDGFGVPFVVDEKYVAPEREVITLQPINK